MTCGQVCRTCSLIVPRARPGPLPQARRTVRTPEPSRKRSRSHSGHSSCSTRFPDARRRARLRTNRQGRRSTRDTDELQNESSVLTAEQRDRLEQARNADKPVFIVTAEEALANEAEGTTETRTWVFKADNVRDFAWASSRKFIWDGMIHRQDGIMYRPTEL